MNYSSNIRTQKYIKQLHNLLLRALHYDLEDPIFRRITINHLRLNRDKTFATVYLDLESIVDKRKRTLILKKINRLNGLFKASLQKNLDRYRIPRFKFVEDKVFSSGQRVESLLAQSQNGKGD